ncbi:MAG: heparinase II/III family protein [Deltaproteobacteria bacterium]|nr:heparinase II/III family protein [Deltaproteobacteria bacterium]
MLIVTMALSPWTASAAPAHWLEGQMTEAGAHPRTLIRADECARVRDRLDREPYRTWFLHAHGLALQEHDPGEDEIGPALARANTARAAALLFFLDRTLDGDRIAPFPDETARRAIGERAALYLREMRTEPRIDSFTLSTHSAHELALWAETLDLLLGADLDVLGADRARCVQNTADLAAGIYGAYAADIWILERTASNNHLSKAASALGLAAIVLNGEDFAIQNDDGRYAPELWIDFAVRNTDLILRQITADFDGGYGEGGFYLIYAALSHLPFFWAWHRYTGGAAYRVTPDVTAPPYYVIGSQTPYTVQDPWTAAWLERSALWAVRVMLPDGSMPPFDDTYPGRTFLFSALVRPEIAHGGLFRWASERGPLLASQQVDPSLLFLATFDDSLASASPEDLGWAPVQLMPFAGHLVFRDGWQADGVCALMLAEHGKAKGWGQTDWGEIIQGAASHEHADPGAAMLYAFGEALLIDGGYLGFGDHARVNQPIHHNLILVDGEGPAMPHQAIPELTTDENGQLVPADLREEGGWVPGEDGDAYAVYLDDEPGAAFAEVVFSYSADAPRTHFRRQAIFLRERFVVLHDRAMPAEEESGERVYTLQLHGHGGATSGGSFELAGRGAVWTRERARLRAACTASAPLELASRTSSHEGPGVQELQHTALDASARVPAAEAVEFLTVLIPEADQGGAFEEVPVTVDQAGAPSLDWRRGDATCAAWTRQDRELTGSAAGNSLLRAAGGAYCESPERLGGLFWNLDGAPDSLVSAWFSFDAGSLTGFRVAVHAAGRDETSLELDLPAIAGQEPDGACELSAAGGRWLVRVPAGGSVRPAFRRSPIAAGLHATEIPAHRPALFELGQEIALSADASCALDGRQLSYAFALVERPAASASRLPEQDPALATIRFLPDLPGVYAVEVTVRGSGDAAATELWLEVEGEGRIDPGEPEPPAPPVPDDESCACGGGEPSSIPFLAWAAWAVRFRCRRRTGSA